MLDPTEGQATRLLERAGAGDAQARQQLLALLYADLHAMARKQLRDQAPGRTLQTTDLLHEAFLRLVRAPAPRAAERAQFLALAARAMRSILVDRARARQAFKRGGGADPRSLDESELDALVDQHQERAGDLVELDAALERLAQVDAELARLVDLRFFGGLTQEEVGQALGLGRHEIERSWRTAQAWLADALRDARDA